MRRALLGSLLIAIAALIGFGVFWFFVRGRHGNEDAAGTLARLSKQGAALTYYARYEGAGKSDPTETVFLTVYNKPGVGFRFELAAPLDPEDDAKQRDDVLKSGDIFIVNLPLTGGFISCRTVRQSCRTADGLEVLVILSFSTLFRYDSPFFEQPHTVTRGDDILAAGETASCFVVTQRTGTKNEQATAESSGFVPGAGLPKTLCYASDGVPVGGLLSDTPPNTDWIKAVEIKRGVDNAVFEPPFPIVPSVYDSTPTAEPSAPQTPP